ncbi:MAG: hypothetical protein QG614_53 [Patescibacteria group bacterium]|nr:hypothetical protein [Patescibacteria group bacterium]
MNDSEKSKTKAMLELLKNFFNKVIVQKVITFSVFSLLLILSFGLSASAQNDNSISPEMQAAIDAAAANLPTQAQTDAANQQALQSATQSGGINNNLTGNTATNTPTVCDGSKGILFPSACEIWYEFSKFVLNVTATIAQYSSQAFDSAVDGFILNIKTLFKEDGGADKAWVYLAWSIVRDFTNILIIFSALYTGVRYIMGLEGENFDFRKSVVRLILTALLINFSFPIAKFLVDMSNFTTLSIRQGIVGAENKSISEVIMRNTGAAPLISDIGNVSGSGSKLTSSSQIWLAILFMVSVLFVFLYGAIMIVVRALILLVTVIFSPLMFLTSSFKAFERVNEVWRSNYIGQLLYAPILMFGFWIALGILGQANSGVNVAAGAGIGSGNLLPLILATVTLFLAVFAAGKVSNMGGSTAGGLVGGAMKTIGLGVTGGVLGYGFRTAGKVLGSRALGGSDWVKNTTNDHNMFRRAGASLMHGSGEFGKNLKLDKFGVKTKSLSDNGGKVGSTLFNVDNIDKSKKEQNNKFKSEVRDLYGEAIDKTPGARDMLAGFNNAKDIRDFKSAAKDGTLREFVIGKEKEKRVSEERILKEKKEIEQAELAKKETKAREKFIKDNNISEENSKSFIRLNDDKLVKEDTMKDLEKDIDEYRIKAQDLTRRRNNLKEEIIMLNKDLEKANPGSKNEEIIKNKINEISSRLEQLNLDTKVDRDSLAASLKGSRNFQNILKDDISGIAEEMESMKETKAEKLRGNKSKKPSLAYGQVPGDVEKALEN